MPPNVMLIYLFIGLASMLGVAQLISWVLKRRYGSTPTLNNLNDRIIAWWLLVGIIGLAMLFGKTGVIVLFFLISFQALREFLAITELQKSDKLSLLVATFVFLPLQYYAVWTDWYGLLTVLIPVYAFLGLPILSSLHGQTKHFLTRTATTQWSLMIGVYCLSYIPAIGMLKLDGEVNYGLTLIAFLIFVVQSSDVFQYVWGKLLGKHKLAPNVSPSKTVEGLIGGILTSTLLGVALWQLTPFTPWQAGLIAFTVSVFGFFGGFVLSAIKRDRDVKD